MAANLGGTPIAVGYIRAGGLGADAVARGVARPTRAIYYPRYIDWVITTPLLLLELLLATGTLLFHFPCVITFLTFALNRSAHV